jgi:AraC family transcriptional regulator of adaptative response / DNA-3-methyladenine glycosylase II
MRALSWPDAFPPGDIGILRGLEHLHGRAGIKPAEALALAEDWRPWRAYAVIHLWNRL